MVSQCYTPFLLIICVHLFPSAMPDDRYIKLLPITHHHSAHFHQEAIQTIATAICVQEAHAIRLIVEPNDATPTAQHLLQRLHTDCRTAPVDVMCGLVFGKRSAAMYPFKHSVLVFVLADWTQFRGQLFNRRLESKGSQRYFLVIEAVVKKDAVHLEWLHHIMCELWLKQILNVVVIFSDGNAVLRWFTYTPFGGGSTERRRVKLIEMNSTADWFINTLRNVERSKLFVTMNDDEVRAVPKDKYKTEGFTGIDGMVADVIRERYVARIIIIIK